MQQVQIPVLAVVNVPMISTAWRKVHNGHNLFQFLRGFLWECYVWVETESLNRNASSTRVPICAPTCAKIFILLFLMIHCFLYYPYFTF
jgi:hypothetical protein